MEFELEIAVNGVSGEGGVVTKGEGVDEDSAEDVREGTAHVEGGWSPALVLCNLPTERDPPSPANAPARFETKEVDAEPFVGFLRGRVGLDCEGRGADDELGDGRPSDREPNRVGERVSSSTNAAVNSISLHPNSSTLNWGLSRSRTTLVVMVGGEDRLYHEGVVEVDGLLRRESMVRDLPRSLEGLVGDAVVTLRTEVRLSNPTAAFGVFRDPDERLLREDLRLTRDVTRWGERRGLGRRMSVSDIEPDADRLCEDEGMGGGTWSSAIHRGSWLFSRSKKLSASPSSSPDASSTFSNVIAVARTREDPEVNPSSDRLRSRA